MNVKVIIFFIIALFIGANLLCGCCQYPIFDYMLGTPRREGMIDNKDVGTPGSVASVKKAESDSSAILSKQQDIPSLVNSISSLTNDSKNKEGMLDMRGLPTLFQNGVNVINNSMGGGPPARAEQLTTNKEGMSVMGSDINEIQNSDVAGMWVTKANTYASEFGYGVINNTGSSYTADEPLKNGEMVIFSKNKFKPECCPSPYSSSTGCVCMTPEQINFLNTRGGNRTSDSGV